MSCPHSSINDDNIEGDKYGSLRDKIEGSCGGLDVLLTTTTAATRPSLDGLAKSQTMLLRRQNNRHCHRHHRRNTSISHILAATEQEVPETLHSQLQGFDSGRDFSMDMNMTRSMSILPEDLDVFVQETADLDRMALLSNDELKAQNPLLQVSPPTTDHDNANTPTPVPSSSTLSAYVMLLLAV